MWRKLGGYLFISLLSFSFGTALLHTVAGAQTPAVTPALPSSTPTPLPTNTPTPTLLPTSTPVPTAIPTLIPPTDTPTPQPTIAVVTDLEALFQRFSDEYHIDKELLKKIARCESGFNVNAENGPYIGMYQFAEQTWITNRNAMGVDSSPDLRKNAEEAIRTAAHMIAKGQQNAWAGCL